jgi:hypothetical protein
MYSDRGVGSECPKVWKHDMYNLNAYLTFVDVEVHVCLRILYTGTAQGLESRVNTVPVHSKIRVS